MKVKATQLCLTLSNSMDYTVHGILQARILEWVAFLFSREIFPTQGSKPGLLHCRWIIYQLSHKGRILTTHKKQRYARKFLEVMYRFITLILVRVSWDYVYAQFIKLHT